MQHNVTIDTVQFQKIKYTFTQWNTTMFFFALIATRFGHYDHHQVNAIQNLKGMVTCSA